MEDKIKEEIMMAITSNNTASVIDMLKQIPTPYFCYDCREDKKKYPNAFKDLKEFLIEHSNGALEDLAEDQLEMAIFVNPRMLYDYFDSKGLNLGITCSSKGIWSYNINDTSHTSSEINTRHDAEKEGISYCLSQIK